MFLYGAVTGWQSGFFKQLVSLGGFLVGLLVAALCYAWLGEYLAPHLGTSISITNLIAFVLLWVIVPIFLGFLADRLTGALKFMKLGTVNSLLGAALGAGKFVILLSCIFNAMTLLGLIGEEKRKDSFLFNPTRMILGSYFGDEDGATLSVRQVEETTNDTVWINFDRSKETSVDKDDGAKP